jgi:predicted esterase
MPHIRVARTARYEVLGSEKTAREIWFVLHGYGQLASSFIRAFAPLDDGTRLIVAPEALNRFYLVNVDSAPAVERPVGATWMTREDREAEISDYVAYLDALAVHVRGAVRHEKQAPRIVVLGFSQGAATATRWLTHGAVHPDHLILWGGFVPPEADLASPALRRTSVHVVVGSRDRYASGERVTAERERFSSAGLDGRFVPYEGGHSIKAEPLASLAKSIATPNA